MLKKVQNILKMFSKDVWILYNHENSDKYFCKLISENLSTSSICFITKKDIYILINELDSKNIDSIKYKDENLHIIIYSTNTSLQEKIEDVIADLKFPKEIALSYSTMSDKNIDILGHGEFIAFSKLIRKPYVKYNKKVKFSSAEKIIYELDSEKTSLEINRLKILATITNKILEKTFNSIKISSTEIQIANLTRQITQDTMKTLINKLDIVEYDMAWDNCPIVLTGVNLAKGGHSTPSDKKLLPGDTVYFDFGIKAKFSDGMVLYTDMQRMGYALKTNEKVAPKNIEKVFNTLVDSIEEGMEYTKPGVKGYVVDEIVRQKITKAGYPDYNHATGHPVGRQVHDSGAIITLKISKRSRLGLVENGIYTLEPRINIANGGSIEEMVLVTKYGGIPLCDTQKKLYLIK